MLPRVYLVHEEGLWLTFDSNMMELWSSCKVLKTNRGCTAQTAGLFTALKCAFIVRLAAKKNKKQKNFIAVGIYSGKGFHANT